ncbi:hypothetical protein F4703DRAFT_1925240 [Phycomyces blakesleeanus]
MSTISLQTHTTSNKTPTVVSSSKETSTPTPLPRQRKVLFEAEPRAVIMPAKSLSPVVPRSRARLNSTGSANSQTNPKIPSYPLPTFSHVKSKIGSKENKKKPQKLAPKEEVLEKKGLRVLQGPPKRKRSKIPLRKKHSAGTQPANTALRHPSSSSSSSSSSTSSSLSVSHPSPPPPTHPPILAASSTGSSVCAVSARPRVISFNIHQNTSGIVRLTAELCDLNIDIKEHSSSR